MSNETPQVNPQLTITSNGKDGIRLSIENLSSYWEVLGLLEAAAVIVREEIARKKTVQQDEGLTTSPPTQP